MKGIWKGVGLANIGVEGVRGGESMGNKGVGGVGQGWEKVETRWRRTRCVSSRQ